MTEKPPMMMTVRPSARGNLMLVTDAFELEIRHDKIPLLATTALKIWDPKFDPARWQDVPIDLESLRSKRRDA
jgi:hypothetical protein